MGGGGLRNPKYVDILDPKSGLFELHPLTLLQTPIFAHFVAKSGAFGRGGGVRCTHRTPLAIIMGLGQRLQ